MSLIGITGNFKSSAVSISKEKLSVTGITFAILVFYASTTKECCKTRKFPIIKLRMDFGEY